MPKNKIKKYQTPDTGLGLAFDNAFNFANFLSKNFNKGLNGSFKPPPAFPDNILGNANTGMSNLFSKLNIGMNTPKSWENKELTTPYTSENPYKLSKLEDSTSTLPKDKGLGLFSGKDAVTKLKSNEGMQTLIGAAPDVLDAGLQAVGVKSGEMSGVEEGIDQGLTAAFKASLQTGNPYAIAITGIATGLSKINKFAGKKANKQGTIGIDTGAYVNQISTHAGKKQTLIGSIGKKSRLRDYNRLTARADRSNLLAANATYQDKTSQQAAQNTYGDITSKNYQQLQGKYNTNMFSAKKGAKIPPQYLSKIKSKAIKNVAKYQTGRKLSFENWYKTVPEEKNDTTHYSLREAYDNLPYEEMEKFSTSNEVHLPDTYKLPTHPSFSNESKFSNEDTPGGRWEERDGEWHFIPTMHNINNMGGVEKYRKWFEQNEPEVILDFPKSLKAGGQLHVIPEGALHARKNNYEGDLKDKVTHKGIPVITYDEGGDIIQHAEIEHSEIIFGLDISKTLEDLFKKHKEANDSSTKKELEVECGKLLKKEILENTQDNVGLLNPKLDE